MGKDWSPRPCHDAHPTLNCFFPTTTPQLYPLFLSSKRLAFPFALAMTECEACKPPLTFLSFTRPLPPSSHDLYEAHSSPAEPDPIHVDSSLVRAAFQSRDRAETLSLQDADWKHDRHSAHLVDAAAMYGYQPPNCIAVGITHGVRGAVIGSVFGGAMGKLFHLLPARTIFDPVLAYTHHRF